MLQIDLVGANPVAPVSQDTAAQPGGSPGAAQPFTQVTYTGVWNGVTAVYAQQDGALFKDTYYVAAGLGGDPASQIVLHFNSQVSLDAQGNLVIATANGTMTDSAPVAWQVIDGQKTLVHVSYELLGNNDVGFAVGAYDHSQQLVIDPSLSWNTFLGSNAYDNAQLVAVDSSGNVYVTGYSAATWGSPVRAYGGGPDEAFVAKLNSSGSLIWNTFLGGSGTDQGYGIAVDGSGNVYVSGSSTATWGAPVQAFSGNTDAFAAELNSSGSLVWNTFLGTGGMTESYGVAVDGSGHVDVAGDSSTTWGSPVRAFGSGNADGFAAQLNSSGSLVWNTFLGGTGPTDGYAVAVDGSGNVYVSGDSNGSWGTPVQAFSGNTDAYAAELNSSGSLVWNTFLGSSGTTVSHGIAVDGSGHVDVAGDSSATWGTPVQAYSGNTDAFAAQLNSSGSLVWNTFLGGSGNDDGFAIAVDGNGNVYVGGDSGQTWALPCRPSLAVTMLLRPS